MFFVSQIPKKLGKILGLCALLLAAHTFVAYAAEETAGFAISAIPVQTPPKIDGTLDDPAWKNAAHVQLNWDFTFRRRRRRRPTPT